MSCLTYISGISVNFLDLWMVIFQNYVTLPFPINFRSQVENQVSDYMLLGASSLFFFDCFLNFFYLHCIYFLSLDFKEKNVFT